LLDPVGEHGLDFVCGHDSKRPNGRASLAGPRLESGRTCTTAPAALSSACACLSYQLSKNCFRDT
jgi:hypothetical protein